VCADAGGARSGSPVRLHPGGEVAARSSGRTDRRRGERQTHRRDEWADAAALLHIDALRLPTFDRPGHWAR